MTRILFIKYADIIKNIFYKSILKMKINLSNTATLSIICCILIFRTSGVSRMSLWRGLRTGRFGGG